jgi:lysophospholipase L1-like esterase
VPPLYRVALVGDSLVDRTTNVMYSTAQNTICYDQRAWGALLEQVTNGQVVGVGPTAANTYKVGALFDRDHGYTGITAYKMVNGDAVFGDLIPIDDAIAADPDFFICSIGTNDVSDQDAPTTIARIRAVWARCVATGKPTVGTDLCQRASAHNTEAIRDKIIAVNTGLRAAWETDGLWGYRQWDDLVLKDSLTGFADASEYPDNNNPTGPDGIHFGADLSLRFANDLKTFLAPYYTGTPPTIPASGSPSWVTPNPYVAGGTTLATDWAEQFMGSYTASKVTDADGVWQRIEILTERTFSTSFANQGVYCRATGAPVTALIGQQVRPTARIRIPAGQNLSGVGISVQCASSATPWTYNALTNWQYDLQPLSEFDAQIYCDPITVPAGTTQIWLMITPARGTGIFEFQKAGVIAL